MIYAHRGASGYAPENTLEAFALAAKQGAHGIELDVHICKSGEIVVIHDETVDRVADGTGAVADMTLDELKALNVSKPIPGFAPTRIPTLEEVYELVYPTGMLVNVELKTGYVDYPGLVEKCIAMADKMGMRDRVLYSSFNHRTLQEVKAIDPSLPCGLLYELVMIEPWKYATDYGMNALHPHLSEVRCADLVPTAHANHLEVNPWTVNTVEEIRMCALAGCDRIITNYPDRALEVIKSL